ncbi:MAG: MoxR-like ATPases [uncultured Sulfurovum sp.]|uniref:MoxR-like ATPases n=1 Tax=uncultured Sulfurovum sp. TaxID=269237 RepID=A0A6S6TTH9_9BACT|nr:MAG: MoxR-like ATPases [uncultured Sulfurovum sp.]
MSTEKKESWWIYEGSEEPHDKIKDLPKPPPWREKGTTKTQNTFIPSTKEMQLVNTALYLRRPLLITGKPGTGKSSLAKAVAFELKLGKVLHWQVTTKSTLEEALYSYDAIGRLQDSSLSEEERFKDNSDIGNYVRLGPLGTAFASDSMRVLLIDEIDKSDIDLPNNLLHVFEENEFIIPELARLNSDVHEVNTYGSDEKVKIVRGKVESKQFPLIILTSNGEREFPPAFLRRCIHLEIEVPNKEKLTKIIKAHLNLNSEDDKKIHDILNKFLEQRDKNSKELSTDQLLNAIFLALKDLEVLNTDKEEILKSIWHSLSK